ncbi:nucleotidyltransferase family protein [Nocardioides sp. CCNWLW239]|uniref:nucleotidyltransferase family protein n=1 Tax=Nocardioides sp. CCNWLW239 TaxID=3128902 RepID=UPI0030193D92
MARTDVLGAELQRQREVLKRVGATLKASEIPFALAGGYAVWTRGGPESTHDVDFVLPEDCVEEAVQALLENGMDRVAAPEDWLVKVGRDTVVVDLIHRLPTGPVDEGLLVRCTELPVDSVTMPVMSATDLVISRMLALSEHACDLSPILGSARALREQIDWRLVRQEAKRSPFAQAALGLLDALDIIEGSSIGGGDD